jgi:hypothetical protein
MITSRHSSERLPATAGHKTGCCSVALQTEKVEKGNRLQLRPGIQFLTYALAHTHRPGEPVELLDSSSTDCPGDFVAHVGTAEKGALWVL